MPDRQRPGVLEAFARRATEWAGSTPVFLGAVLLVICWLVTGPIFGFSNTWQLMINTGTTIATFLMVFLIQRAQNKDSRAIHLKLNELVAALEGASNRLVEVEDLSEEELATLHAYYGKLAELAKRDHGITHSHSIEEAMAGHALKHGRRRVIPPPAPPRAPS